MPTKSFNKRDLAEMAYGDAPEELEIIKTEIVDTSRWSIHHEQIFLDKTDGKYYKTGYSVGATEQQCERPYDYEPDEIVCYEVEPYEVSVIRYRLVKD